MLPPLQIDDPRLLLQSGEPRLCFCNEENLIARAIDFRTNIVGIHPWNHAMVSIDKGEFVWQSMGIFNAYKQGPMSVYMKKGTQLGFIKFVNNNPAFAAAFNKSVQKRLTAPWWITQYDYLGIFGQAIGQPWIHTPGLRYCSVDALRHAVNACPNLPKSDQLVLNNIPAEINPEALWNVILQNPHTFFIEGIYDSSSGVIE